LFPGKSCDFDTLCLVFGRITEEEEVEEEEEEEDITAEDFDFKLEADVPFILTGRIGAKFLDCETEEIKSVFIFFFFLEKGIDSEGNEYKALEILVEVGDSKIEGDEEEGEDKDCGVKRGEREEEEAFLPRVTTGGDKGMDKGEEEEDEIKFFDALSLSSFSGSSEKDEEE
jgi:hypothetical protein